MKQNLGKTYPLDRVKLPAKRNIGGVVITASVGILLTPEYLK